MVAALFVWQGNQGFSLADEGYLWYGAQRVLLGEVPIRDFMAYDPGRYYWSAAFMSLLSDDGIMALRGAVAIFQAIGLGIGLLLIARTTKKQHLLYLLLSAAILTLWMFPRHKLFDISLSLILLGVLTFLVHSPTNRRYFIAGLCVGLVAVFGRNHGVYAVAGSLGVLFWLNMSRTEGPGLPKAFALWTAGVTTGFSPILLMALFVPGFANAFWNGIRFLFEIKATNLPLPIPWPWLVDFNSEPLGESVRGVLIGFFFIAVIAFGILASAWIFWRRFHNKHVFPPLVAASLLALPHAHYAFSRADVGHLAQGRFPTLVGCLLLLSPQPAKFKWPLALMLFSASLWVTHIFHPGWQSYVNSRWWLDVEISGTTLQVDPNTARDIELLRTLAEGYAPNGESFIATPFWPGAYALLKRQSPMWEIYALFPRSPDFERAEIERIQAASPYFILVLDLPLDGRDELRFRNTHPLIHKYILDNFEPLPNTPGPAYQIYKTRENRNVFDRTFFDYPDPGNQ
jgi:hypothetical protein